MLYKSALRINIKNQISKIKNLESNHMNKKTISIHEMQAQASKIIKDVEAGSSYQVMRYSKPVARIISEKEYQCLTGECRGCVQDLVKNLKLNK